MRDTLLPRILRRRRPLALTALAAAVVVGVGSSMAAASPGGNHGNHTGQWQPGRAALPPGLVDHILVIDLENEGFAKTFGAGSPATYLNGTLLPQGELVQNYFATGHASLDNYIAQVSGQAPTKVSRADCIVSFNPFAAKYLDVSPGMDDPHPASQPGQVDGQGCVYPAPTATSHGAPTIADQLDAVAPPNAATNVASWRGYLEDMGNNPARDGGTPDPSGGTDCAHPAINASDNAFVASPTDQYATRHNPFVYFHSVIDKPAECDANVVPLGTLTAAGTPDPAGHLARDLSSPATTPEFGFISPNVCDDGHDATCAGVNAEGTHVGGLAGADLWLKHWMPLILNSPAYQSGRMLVVLTFDEADINPSDPASSQSCCYEQPGPNVVAPGDFFNAQTLNTMPGGGQTGAVLFNRFFIRPGSVNTTGSYNHYSALRSYEDLLGLFSGGADGQGHLGFAGAPGLQPFGTDVFNRF